jgi:hypothetical protein
MTNVIVQPVLNFYKFYNVPLARRVRQEIEQGPLNDWISSFGPAGSELEKNHAHHHDLKDQLACLPEVRAWIQSCLDQVAQDDLPQDAGCGLTEMWLTRSVKEQKGHVHMHPLSVYSGIFYLQDSPGGTDFYIPKWYHDRWPQMTLPATFFERPSTRVPTREGHLIIFPSHIHHGLAPYQGDDVRYSLAFNSFWRGQISDRRSLRLWLDSQEFDPHKS